MNNSKSKKKEARAELEIGARYKIDGKGYEIIEITTQHIYAAKIDELGEYYGRNIILGSLKNKQIEKI
jgi:hypothetical protein